MCKLPSGDKFSRLKEYIKNQGRVVVAFSGGVDSSTLAVICNDLLGKNAVALTVDSPTLPRRDYEDAISIAKRFGLNHLIIRDTELKSVDFVRNDPNRCYFCKKQLVEICRNIAKKMNAVIFEATTISELSERRPGLRAIREGGVISPFILFGITKEDVRDIAKSYGIEIWDKPSSPCLSSRFAYGEKITVDKLERVENGEQYIRKILKPKILRLRIHGKIARIEVDRGSIERIIDSSIREDIVNYIKSLGFNYVTLDLEGYRVGSIDESLRYS